MSKYKVEVKQNVYTKELKEVMYDNFSDIMRDLSNSSLESSKWDVRSYYSDGVCCFDFSMIPEEYVEIVKTYLLIRFAKKYSIESTRSHFSMISYFLTYEKNEEEEVFLIDNNLIYNTLKSFVAFTNDQELYVYFEKFITRRRLERDKFREIPEYESLIEIDYIISDFYNSASDEELLFYFPIILWWEFASIVPMRRSELLLIKKDCVSDEGSNYVISVPTLKKRSSNTEIPYSSLTISKEIYDLIRFYQEATVQEEREYLFSIEIYKQVIKTTVASGRRLSAKQLRRILNKFLEEIVEGRYHRRLIEKDEVKDESEEIERIMIGDLRHVAFYNAMIQGLDPLTIQRLARHSSIYSQEAYYSNMKPYCKSKANVMAKRIKQKMLNEASVPDLDNHNPFRTRDNLICLIRNKEQNYHSLRDMGDVYCTSDNFPYDCPFDTECLLCPKHIPKKNASDKLLKKNEAIHRREMEELDETVELMRMIRKERFFDMNEDKQTVKRLNCIINRIAMVTAQLEDSNGKEKDW